jgi:hypothetical protein
VFPEERSLSQEFLTAHNMKVDQVTPNRPLTDIGVDGTPTVILVKPDGRIAKEWVGELDPKTQDSVISQLGN